MTTTAMKRAGQLVAHLGILHQISDVRQLLLLQLAMRERQDQVALFKRQGGSVTLGLIGTQFAAPTAELSHRAGSVSAGALFEQLQAISGIAGDDVAFSAGQIHEMIVAQTHKIETSDELARLDAALLGLMEKLELEQQAAPAAVEAVQDGETSPAAAPETEADLDTLTPDTSEETDGSGDQQAEPESGFPTVRATRRRSA